MLTIANRMKSWISITADQTRVKFYHVDPEFILLDLKSDQ